MSIIQELLKGTQLPRMVKIRQKFKVTEVSDISETIRQEFAKAGIGDRVKAGMRIAIAVGSRGLDKLPELVRLTVVEIKKRGGQPFVVPAMGSHGGATASGQERVLANLGVTEESVGCPIISSMEVVEIGKIDNGLAVHMDKQAYEADGIVVINRIKPHTAYRGPCESGLAKMLTIGLGKQKGAETCHMYSFKHMAEHVFEMAQVKIARSKVLFAIGTVENAYDKISTLVAVPAENIMDVDQKLLFEAKAKMPRILFDSIDVLVVDQIGKEISGDGMDPNITGRYPTPYASGGPDVNKLVVLDLTKETNGNACGIGVGDYTTRKLFNKIDFDYTYANCITNTTPAPARLPMVMADDREALLAAVKTCNARDMSKVKLVRIKDTLHLGEILISEALLEEAQANPDIEICGDPTEMQFDDAGNLIG
ncbi:lactate racemase domain-containing protein [Sporomusa sp.]|uniref:lactate racemase domain-containing protein n=1 Tax=Sporomusa sp. TaxID=2078658 RepID=UPI002BF925C6|nr:lactate racemase domain-containing protein [Sporomusa sp.]HWR45102.1 lactate racemase domain-containing protein [Sporomusa sp.]